MQHVLLSTLKDAFDLATGHLPDCEDGGACLCKMIMVLERDGCEVVNDVVGEEKTCTPDDGLPDWLYEMLNAPNQRAIHEADNQPANVSEIIKDALADGHEVVITLGKKG